MNLYLKLLIWSTLGIGIFGLMFLLGSRKGVEPLFDFLAYALPCLAAAIAGGGFHYEGEGKRFFRWSVVPLLIGLLCYCVAKADATPYPAAVGCILLLGYLIWLLLKIYWKKDQAVTWRGRIEYVFVGILLCYGTIAFLVGAYLVFRPTVDGIKKMLCS